MSLPPFPCKAVLERVTTPLGCRICESQPRSAGQDWIFDWSGFPGSAPRLVMFDVGANTCGVALRLPRACPPPSRLVALEPAAKIFARLSATCCSIAHNQSCRLGLARDTGELRFFHGIDSQLSRLASAGPLGLAAFEEMQVRSLDGLADERAVRWGVPACGHREN